MDLPGYNFLSAPLWLITVLHWVTLTVHFVAMNFVVGGIVALLWGKISNRWEDAAVKQFVKLLPSATAAAVTFGVAPLLFLQLVYHRQAYSASIVSAWHWLLILLGAMLAYYLLYAASFGKGPGSRKRLFLTLAFAALLYVSWVFSSVFSMAEQPELIRTLYASDQSGLAVNTSVSEWLLRWLHMLTGAITVGGFCLGFVGRKSEKLYAVGKQFFLWGFATAGLLGLVYLFTLGEYIVPFMRSMGIWALTAAILLTAGALHFYFKRKFVGASLMLFVSILGMVITRHLLRMVRLQEYFEPSSLPVNPQWSVFAVFLVCFLIAIALVWYMLRLFFAGKGVRA